jgi:hypothetical protein
LLWKIKTAPVGRWWNVQLLKIARKNVDPGKPAGKLHFYIITGRKFLRNVSTARYSNKTR